MHGEPGRIIRICTPGCSPISSRRTTNSGVPSNWTTTPRSPAANDSIGSVREITLAIRNAFPVAGASCSRSSSASKNRQPERPNQKSFKKPASGLRLSLNHVTEFYPQKQNSASQNPPTTPKFETSRRQHPKPRSGSILLPIRKPVYSLARRASEGSSKLHVPAIATKQSLRMATNRSCRPERSPPTVSSFKRSKARSLASASG